jgi:MoaA/NifB/PqqE/SkfB family radical SAM enzyme
MARTPSKQHAAGKMTDRTQFATPVAGLRILPAVSKRTLAEKLRAVQAVVVNRLHDDPLNITLELTRRCNAKCDYCNHWQEQRQTEQEIDDFVAVVRRFRPFSVTICGGEPFMRKDALQVIRAVVDEPGWRYVSIITNGWFLSEDRAQKLLDTGIDQINVSLNFPDERQDTDRKLPGLFKKISHIVPWMVARGGNVQMNSIIMNDNLDDVVPIAHLAASWGASVMYTLYSELPADNHGHLFPPERQARLFEVLGELSAIKRRTPGVVANAQWYFDMIPTYIGGTIIDGCTAGKKTLHISPGGMVRPCAELPAVSHYTEYDHHAIAPVTCTRCFQACRGEVQAPLSFGRIADALRSA